MTSLASPLQRERSIEVLPGSSSAASELTYALFEERTRSETLRITEGYLPSDMLVLPSTPILKASRFSGTIPSASSPLKSKEACAITDSVAVNKQSETVAYTQVSLDKIVDKETSSTSSSEKENSKAQKKNKKKKNGIMKFLRPKAVQRKPPKKSVRANMEVPKMSKKNIEPSRTHVGSTLDDTSPVATKREMEERVILGKAKEYTLKSTALLDSLKQGDSGNHQDIAESIKQAKLAYEYAVKARKLYNSVGSRNDKPLCDDSVNNFSVASSHDTEKAGNVTTQITKSLLSDMPIDSSDDQQADTPNSSLSVDVTGNVAPNVGAESSPGSIEIEHDGKIMFEAPYSSIPPTHEDLHSGSAGIQDMLEIADSFRPNQEVEIDSEAQAHSRDRSLSPLSSILGNVATKAVDPCLSTNKSSLEQFNKDEAEHFQLDHIVEVKRVKSDIFYPPALHLSRSSVTAKSNTDGVQMSRSEIPIHSLLSQETDSILSDNTTSSQKLLIHHQEVEGQRRPAPKPF